MNEEETGSAARYAPAQEGADRGDTLNDTLSLTDFIDRLDRASFLASLEHRPGPGYPHPGGLNAIDEDA